MESTKYTIKEAVQAIQDLALVRTTTTSSNTLKKESKTMTFLK